MADFTSNIPSGQLDQLMGILQTLANKGAGGTATTPNQGAAFDAFARTAENAVGVGVPTPAENARLQQAIAGMQKWVKTLTDAGVPLGVLNKQIEQLTNDTKLTEQVMGRFRKELVASIDSLFKSMGSRGSGRPGAASQPMGMEYSGDNSQQAIRGNATSKMQSMVSGMLGGALGVGGKTFSAAALETVGTVTAVIAGFDLLDKAAADVNTNVGRLSMSMGIFDKAIGSGALFGGGKIVAGPEGERLKESLGQYTEAMKKSFDISVKDSTTMALAITPTMRRSQAKLYDQAILKGESAQLQGIPGQEGIEAHLLLMKRLGISGDLLDKQFNKLLSTSKSSELSNRDMIQVSMDLWSSMRLFGTTLETSRKNMDDYNSELARGAITRQEVAGVSNRAADASDASIMALWQMGKNLTGDAKTSYDALFKGVTTPMGALGAFTVNGPGLKSEEWTKMAGGIGVLLGKGMAGGQPSQYETVGAERRAYEFMQGLPGGGTGLRAFLRTHHGAFMKGVPSGVEEAVGAGVDENMNGAKHALGKMKHFQDASHHFWNNWARTLEANATKLMYYSSKLDSSKPTATIHNHTHIQTIGALADQDIAAIEEVTNRVHQKKLHDTLRKTRDRQ